MKINKSKLITKRFYISSIYRENIPGTTPSDFKFSLVATPGSKTINYVEGKISKINSDELVYLKTVKLIDFSIPNFISAVKTVIDTSDILIGIQPFNYDYLTPLKVKLFGKLDFIYDPGLDFLHKDGSRKGYKYISKIRQELSDIYIKLYTPLGNIIDFGKDNHIILHDSTHLSSVTAIGGTPGIYSKTLTFYTTLPHGLSSGDIILLVRSVVNIDLNSIKVMADDSDYKNVINNKEFSINTTINTISITFDEFCNNDINHEGATYKNLGIYQILSGTLLIKKNQTSFTFEITGYGKD